MKTSIIQKYCLAACALTLVAITALADQPDRWVRYVESQGTAWIDTGITGRPNTKIECQVEWMNLADSAFVACGEWQSNTRFYMCYCKDADGVIILSQRVNEIVTLKNGWNSRFEKNRIYNYAASFSATNSAGESTGTVTVDGIGPWSKTYTGLNTGRSLYVFANNSADGTVGGKSKSRCYGLKIYQGPEDGGDMVLVRDFQPCIQGGVAGLYDSVSDTIFFSISGTPLICDEDSEVPDEFIEYVESQGEAANADDQKPAYIDTGVIGKAGTTAEFKETCLKTVANEFCLLGARSDSNTRFFMWYHANGNTLGLGYAGDYWRPNVNNPDATSSQGAADVYPMAYGDTTHALVSFAAGLQTFSTIDDGNGTTNLVSRQTISTSVNTGKSLYVFARNNNGTPDSFCASRLYGLKLWQDGVLVRDFRPCLKNGMAGLYDDVSKRIFYSLGTPLVYNNVYRENVKPKEVVFVEYIESDGNNTLDTGVPARSGIRAKGKMAWMGPKNDNDATLLREWNYEVSRYLEQSGSPNVFYRQQHAYLAAVNAKTGSQFYMVHSNDRYFDMGYGTGDTFTLTSGGSKLPPTIGTEYSFDVTLADGSQTFDLNGTEVFRTNITGTVDVGDTLHLFSTSIWRHRSMARCYGLEIYQDGTLVRDFKPCICKEKGVFKGMLYDAVTKSIYRPSPDIPLSRTGNIVLTGEEKPACYVDYVETNGKQFIDTGVIGKAATTAEFKETCLQLSTSEECFLGSFGNDARFYIWYHAWGSTAGMGYGEYWRPKNNDPYTPAANSSDPDVYKQNVGDTTHARISFAVGSQTFTAIDDATGIETLYSSRNLSDNVDTGRTMYLFAKNDNNAGNPISPAGSRFYFLKIWQGNSNGTGMQLVRNFRPVKLSNGLVVLWDSVEKKAYPVQSTTSPYNYTFFPVVGQDGAEIAAPFTIVVR